MSKSRKSMSFSLVVLATVAVSILEMSAGWGGGRAVEAASSHVRATRPATVAKPGVGSNLFSNAASDFSRAGSSGFLSNSPEMTDPAATFTVINTNDSGAGSLRQAILDANAAAGLDSISFAIPGGGVKTISPTSALPSIIDAVIIDGYTQPGSVANTNAIGALNTVLMIELNGTGAGVSSGLTIPNGSSGGNTIRGLAINRFSIHAIAMSFTNGNLIEGNFLGTNVAGTQ